VSVAKVIVGVDARHLVGPEVKGKERCLDLQSLAEPVVERRRGGGKLGRSFIVEIWRCWDGFGAGESDVGLL
jgi:hypothetical protein